jgi:hypothetical protein
LGKGKTFEQGEEAINSILTDEQKVKFEEYRAKIKEEMKPGATAQE